MTLFSDTVMEHFLHPRNVGNIEYPDGVGSVGNATCGDMITFAITVRDDRIADVKFKTFGCGAAIAVSSMVSEMAMGKRLDDALRITNEMVAEELGGLPANKMHCSNLGADALRRAIEDYRERLRTGEQAPATAAPAGGGSQYACPFCDRALEEAFPFCEPCGSELVGCPLCGMMISKSLELCPHCGARVDAKSGGKGGGAEHNG